MTKPKKLPTDIELAIKEYGAASFVAGDTSFYTEERDEAERHLRAVIAKHVSPTSAKSRTKDIMKPDHSIEERDVEAILSELARDVIRACKTAEGYEPGALTFWEMDLRPAIEKASNALRAPTRAPEEGRLDAMRADGWMVAVHNDYRQDGEHRTFWLLTQPDGRYVKGEGCTDAEAFDAIVRSLGFVLHSSDAEEAGP